MFGRWMYDRDQAWYLSQIRRATSRERAATAARAAMQDHHRHAMGIAALLDIQVMTAIHRQNKLVEWLDLGIE